MDALDRQGALQPARPHVVYHVAASLDGRIDGFAPDVELFYRLAGGWHEDVTLTGADTLLAAEPALGAEPAAPSRDERQARAEAGAPAGSEAETADTATPGAETRALLAVVDSRGRVRDWPRLRAWPYWRGALALCSAATPAGHLERLAALGVETVVAGGERVDLAAALAELARRHGARVVRVDSGGDLAGALFAAGLVDEVSVLLHPALVGGATARQFFRVPEPRGPEHSKESLTLDLRVMERLEGGVVWLRYDVLR